VTIRLGLKHVFLLPSQICHLSRKREVGTCDVFCLILTENRHILALLVQNFFEREEM